MNNHPDKKAIVLCGHTHGSGEYSPSENVKVITSAAIYRYPRLSGVVTI